jgi:hypothetical protein
VATRVGWQFASFLVFSPWAGSEMLVVPHKNVFGILSAADRMDSRGAERGCCKTYCCGITIGRRLARYVLIFCIMMFVPTGDQSAGSWKSLWGNVFRIVCPWQRLGRVLVCVDWSVCSTSPCVGLEWRQELGGSLHLFWSFPLGRGRKCW